MSVKDKQIRISLNGDDYDLPTNSSLSALIEQWQNKSGMRCVVSINEQHIPHDSFAKHELATGDRVEILTVRQGG